MTWGDILSSIITGLISSAIFLIVLEVREQRKWRRTKKFFLSQMQGQIYLANYEILMGADINPMYDDSDEHKSDEVIKNELLDSNISAKSYTQMAWHFDEIKRTVATLRAQALAIPTFTPADFHSIDKSVQIIQSYTSAYYFFSPLEESGSERTELEKSLKEKLIGIYFHKQ